MPIVAVLRNWNPEARKGGAAWIDLVNDDGDNEVTTVTVSKGQSAKSALAVAGWDIISGVRKNKNGDPTCLVKRASASGMGPAARMSLLVRETGLV